MKYVKGQVSKSCGSITCHVSHDLPLEAFEIFISDAVFGLLTSLLQQADDDEGKRQQLGNEQTGGGIFLSFLMKIEKVK